MKYRHEFKQEINLSDIITLRTRLNAVCKKDSYCQTGSYVIRSLYFDNIYDKALNEKINGVNNREKFRIRIYDGNKGTVFLEKKSKINGLCLKKRQIITAEETEKILNNDFSFINEKSGELLIELLFKIKTQNLKPKTIVEYTREAFVFPAGNVRITLDYNIKTGIESKDFLNDGCALISPNTNSAVLEVKFDEFLPDVIRDIVQIPGRRTSAFSKYAECRRFG